VEVLYQRCCQSETGTDIEGARRSWSRNEPGVFFASPSAPPPRGARSRPGLLIRKAIRSARRYHAFAEQRTTQPQMQDRRVAVARRSLLQSGRRGPLRPAELSRL